MEGFKFKVIDFDSFDAVGLAVPCTVMMPALFALTPEWHRGQHSLRLAISIATIVVDQTHNDNAQGATRPE